LILIWSQPVFALIPFSCVLSREVSNLSLNDSLWFDTTGTCTTIYSTRGLTQQGHVPRSTPLEVWHNRDLYHDLLHSRFDTTGTCTTIYSTRGLTQQGPVPQSTPLEINMQTTTPPLLKTSTLVCVMTFSCL
jgi:hypothetical protein